MLGAVPSGATPTASKTLGGGWRIVPLTWERRSLLIGISSEEPLRMDTRFEKHTRIGKNGLLAKDWTPSRCTLSELPGAERLGEKCSDEASATSAKTTTWMLDPIPSKLLKEVFPEVIDPILAIINLSLSSGYVPKTFKLAVISLSLKNTTWPQISS